MTCEKNERVYLVGNMVVVLYSYDILFLSMVKRPKHSSAVIKTMNTIKKILSIITSYLIIFYSEKIKFINRLTLKRIPLTHSCKVEHGIAFEQARPLSSFNPNRKYMGYFHTRTLPKW